MAWLDLRSGKAVPPFDLAFTAEATTAEDELSAAAGNPALGIRFSRFGDGRGFSLARILRERLGFAGTLVSLGPTLPDQAHMLRRCGFDIAEIADGRVEAARRALARFDAYYQKKTDGAEDEPHAREEHIEDLPEGPWIGDEPRAREEQVSRETYADPPRAPPSPLVGEGAPQGRIRGPASAQASARPHPSASAAPPHPSAPQTPSPTRGEGGSLPPGPRLSSASEGNVPRGEARAVPSAAEPFPPSLDPHAPPLTPDGQETATVSPSTATAPIAALDIPALDAALAATDDLDARLLAVRAAVSGRIAFATSLQKEDQAILDSIARTGVDVDVFTLDTGRLFPEIYETIERTEARYGLRIRIVAPEAPALEALVARDGVLGFRQSIENRHRCCGVRKVEPLKRALAGAAAWITGIRRDQTGTRADMAFAAFDAADGLLKLNPIADWSLERLDAWLKDNDVPINPMQARGFPSVGCQPCTRRVEPGEDIRAGRWWWERDDHKECGLHWAVDPDDPTVDRPEAGGAERVAA